MWFAKVGTVLAGMVLMTPAAAASAAAQQPSGELVLQQALHLEQVEGNLQQALTLYRRILVRYPADRAVDATAQLHIGLCYESLGEAEARRAYEQVISNYADQTDEVREARTHLASLQPAPVAGRGPVARRLLGSDNIDEDDLIYVAQSPDGRRIAFSRVGVDRALVVRDLSTSEEEVLDAGAPDRGDAYPVWSWNGKRIAFHQDDWKSGRGVVKIIDLDNRHVTTVPGTGFHNGGRADHQPSFNPVDWSRDGRFLLCRTTGGWQPGGLVLVPVGGGPIVPVSDSVTPESKATISPDGRYVAYAAGAPDKAEVYVQPVAGGARRQITDAPDYQGSPVWSPDGRDISYTGPDGIWLVPMHNGQRAGLPRLAYPSATDKLLSGWTEPGGLHFSAFNREATAYRFPVDPVTGEPLAAPDRLPSPAAVRRFAWSPDMRQIAFTAFQSSNVTVYSADGRALTAHRVDPHPQEYSPHVPHSVGWAAGGRQILYGDADRGGEWLAGLDLSTGHVQELVTPRARYYQLSMSADGRRIVYHDPRRGVVVADSGDTNGVLVAAMRDRDGEPLSYTLAPRLSPRGDEVLFGRQANLDTRTYDPAAATLWVVGSDGSGPRRLGTPLYRMESAVWDPTERFIAYSGQLDSATYALRVVNVASGRVREVPLPDPKAEAYVTDWSPDGNYIGLVSNRERVEYWVVQGLRGGRR